jgi:hypothetical protein
MRENGSPDPDPEDDITASLAGLADRLRTELAGAATVEHSENRNLYGIAWEVRPDNPRSVPVVWMVFGEEILLQAGRLDRGGRWELDRTAEDVDFVERVVRAAIAGRVTETSAPARSRVEVTFEDGRVVHETGYEGCSSVLLPLPGWRRWGRVIHYEPYGVR